MADKRSSSMVRTPGEGSGLPWKKRLFSNFLSIIKTAVVIVIMVLLFDTLGIGRTTKTFLLGLFVYSLWRLFSNWDLLMQQIRIIESFFFGRPLDRENWKPGELRKRKNRRKFVWRRKRD